MPKGRYKLQQHLAALDPEDDTALSGRIRQLIDDMRAEWLALDQRIAAFDNEFATHARANASARRLATIPGIGVLNATALVAAIGNGEAFARGRDLAAWLGEDTEPALGEQEAKLEAAGQPQPNERRRRSAIVVCSRRICRGSRS